MYKNIDSTCILLTWPFVKLFHDFGNWTWNNIFPINVLLIFFFAFFHPVMYIMPLVWGFEQQDRQKFILTRTLQIMTANFLSIIVYDCIQMCVHVFICLYLYEYIYLSHFLKHIIDIYKISFMCIKMCFFLNVHLSTSKIFLLCSLVCMCVSRLSW